MSGSAVQDRAERPVAAGASRSTRGTVAALAVGMMVLAGLFFREFQAAVEVWNASTAYGHCYLIVPMTLYLLWDRRGLVERSVPCAEPRWALLGLPLALGWLGAERLGIMEGRQLAAVAGFELLFIVVLGWRLFWQVSGPLLYLFFLVPFGAFVTPALQHFTANFTVVGLNLFGIPNYSDNFIIETPAGTFLVAEACAGLRFLIAAIAFGVFYALLCFRSPVRRSIYIALSIVVPVIANGFRALGIVVLGQIMGNAQAAAADHIIYGWVFFSIVMLLLVAVGQPFRESAVLDAGVPAPPRDRSAGMRPMWRATCTVLLLAVGPAAAAAIDLSAVMGPLSGAIGWNSPPGCEIGPARPLVGGRQSFSLACGTGPYEIEVTTYASRSTARAILADRRRHTHELSAEDTTISALPGNEGWTVVQTAEPNGVSAYATWIDGRPAQSGLQGRVTQARDSLFGSPYQPVQITITAADPGRTASAQRRAVIAQIASIVSSQAELGERIAQISRVGAAP